MVNANSTETNLLNGWKTRLASLADLQVPTDYPRPLPSRSVEEVQTLELPEQTLLGILQLSMNPKVKATPFSILLAAFAVLLQRYTGDEEFAVGSSSASGNPLVLRLAVDPTNTFQQIVEMVQKVSGCGDSYWLG
jgi:L-aminoadipate-semialdehyde dehydrogenase